MECFHQKLFFPLGIFTLNSLFNSSNSFTYRDNGVNIRTFIC